MLWVRNLSVMELGALFSKTGIFCLKHCFANVCVVLCRCVIRGKRKRYAALRLADAVCGMRMI